MPDGGNSEGQTPKFGEKNRDKLVSVEQWLTARLARFKPQSPAADQLEAIAAPEEPSIIEPLPVPAASAVKDLVHDRENNDTISHFYEPKATERIQVQRIDNKNSSLPFKTDFHQEGQLQATVMSEHGEQSRVMKISSGSGRAYEHGDISGKIIFSDEFGNLYGGHGVKGAEMSDLQIQYIEGQGFRVKGLLSSLKDVEKVRKVSDFLRSKGIPIEWISNIYQLQEVVYDGRKMSIEKWKEKIVQEAEERVAKIKREAIIPEFANIDIKDNPELLREFLAQNVFVAVERNNPVAESISDYMRAENSTNLRLMMGRVFGWLNTANEVSKQYPKKWQYYVEKKLDAGNDEDIKYYLFHWFPEQAGRYVGVIHSANCTHDNATISNWLGSATLKDLETVKLPEEVANEREIEKRKARDILETIGVFHYMTCHEGKKPDSAAALKAMSGGKNYIFEYINKLGLSPSECFTRCVILFISRYVETCFEELTKEKGTWLENFKDRVNFDSEDFSWEKVETATVEMLASAAFYSFEKLTEIDEASGGHSDLSWSNDIDWIPATLEISRRLLECSIVKKTASQFVEQIRRARENAIPPSRS